MGVDKPVKGDKKRQKKAPSKSQPRKSQPPGKESLGSSKSIGAPQDELLANIKSLGGNEEDYKLVKDLSSGDEEVEVFEGEILNVGFSFPSLAPLDGILWPRG